MKPRFTFVLAAAAALALWPAIVSAHAVLLRATPSGSQTLTQAPAVVQLLFSEPLDPVFSRVQVANANKQRVDVGDSRLDPENDRLLVVSLQQGLPNGVYTVAWRSLSAIDVHPDAGEYSLFVGVPVTRETASTTTTTTATPETTFGRWWFYVAASLFGGVLAAWKLVLGPSLAGTRSYATVQRRAYRLIVAGGALLVLGTLFTAVAQAASAANVPLTGALGQPLADLLLRGRFAAIWWPRVGLEVASLLLVGLGGIDGLASECALATLPAVLLTSSLTSHGAALAGRTGPGIAIDWLHIVAATAWVGGLLALAFVPRAVRAQAEWRVLVARFARLALGAAAAVLVSGVLQGVLEVTSLAALVGSLYGLLVIAKSVLLVAMLALAGWNEWRRRSSVLAGLQGGVRLELIVGVIVFAVAAVLSGTPPPPNG